MPREILARGLERRQHELQAESAHALRLLVRALLERHERHREAENLEHARQAERLLVFAERGTPGLALRLRDAPGAFRRRPRRRRGVFVRGRPRRDAVLARRRILREIRRGDGGVDARRALLAIRGKVRQPSERGVHDFAEHVPGEVAEQRALLAGLVPDAVARLHDVAHVVVREQAPRRTPHALEQHMQDLGEHHVVVVGVRRLEAAQRHRVRHRVHRLRRVRVTLADQAVLQNLVHRRERHPVVCVFFDEETRARRNGTEGARQGGAAVTREGACGQPLDAIRAARTPRGTSRGTSEPSRARSAGGARPIARSDARTARGDFKIERRDEAASRAKRRAAGTGTRRSAFGRHRSG